MAVKSLAVKYRPKSFDDVVEQSSIKIILQQQLYSNETKNAYLFCGGAGTGKTTCARIFAIEINHNQGNPIEMDAASNSGVEDVRSIIQQAKTKSLDSEYKVFIIDECHSISNTGWQAFLKLIEEPPAKSVFIFCTTDPQKIPKTILSRVQRYDFSRISFDKIVDRLVYICERERDSVNAELKWELDAIKYIAKVADGGMRDAITLMDKCIAYNSNLTMENVIHAIGTVDYDTMFALTNDLIDKHPDNVLMIIENVHHAGKDLKQFIKTYTNFVLDLNKYGCLKSFDIVEIPNSYKNVMDKYTAQSYEEFKKLLATMVKLNADIKWETSPKAVIEAVLVLKCMEVNE
jgi:DNA polymerase III subunit gamma/tau